MINLQPNNEKTNRPVGTNKVYLSITTEEIKSVVFKMKIGRAPGS